MNYFCWEFSNEAQPELNKFLDIVNKNKHKELQLEERFLQLFPQLKEIRKHSGNNKDLTEKLNENDSTEIDTEIPSEPQTNISIFDTTQTIVNHSEEKTLNADIDAFIEYLFECLENENNLLESKFILKLINDYNSHNLNYIFTKLYDMSDNGLYFLNKSICNHSEYHLKNILEIYCRVILFQKIQKINPTRKILSIMKEFSDAFPEETKKELLILIIAPNVEGIFFPTIINILSDAQKQYLLRDFVYSVNELEVWQLSVLESLLSSKTEDIVKRRLINLMEVSADKFKAEKLFIKLLILLINNLESDFEDQEQILFSMIEKSKTVNKVAAQKALKKWSDKFIVQ